MKSLQVFKPNHQKQMQSITKNLSKKLSNSLHYLSFFVLILFSFSCTTGKFIKKTFLDDNYCNNISKETISYDKLIQEKIENDTIISKELVARFTPRVLSVAADIGVLSILNEFIILEKKGKNRSTDENIAFLSIRQNIDERISLAGIEIFSTLAEIECEQDRALAMQNFINNEINKKVKRRTIISILAGAATTVAASALTLKEAEQYWVETSVSGGAILSAVYAFATLNVNYQAEFMHQRNYLADIWFNPKQPTTFAPMVWHFLTRELEKTDKKDVVRDKIVKKWIELEFLDQSDKDKHEVEKTLYFGKGGKYDANTIAIRVLMLDFLETEVSEMKQELKQFRQEILLYSLKN